MRPRRWFVYLPAFALTLHATTTDAQSLDGALRIGLEGVLLATEQVTLAGELLGGKSKLKRTQVGLVSDGLGVVLGYAAADAVVVGTRLALGRTEQDVDSDHTTTTHVGLVPSLEVLLFPGSGVQPFIDCNLGLHYNTSASEELDQRRTELVFGLGAGAHLFPVAGGSLDLRVALAYRTGTIDLTVRSPPDPPERSKAELSGWSVLVTAGLSLWPGTEGGTESVPAEAAPDAWFPPTPRYLPNQPAPRMEPGHAPGRAPAPPWPAPTPARPPPRRIPSQPPTGAAGGTPGARKHPYPAVAPLAPPKAPPPAVAPPW